MTELTEHDDELLRKRAGNRQMIALGVMNLGLILGALSFWMFLDAGGTLLQQPDSNLWIVPGVPGFVLMVGGFWSL